jgi:hypothetical protein
MCFHHPSFSNRMKRRSKPDSICIADPRECEERLTGVYLGELNTHSTINIENVTQVDRKFRSKRQSPNIISTTHEIFCINTQIVPHS